MMPTTATPTMFARSCSDRTVVSSHSRRNATATPTTSPAATATKKITSFDWLITAGAPAA
jgi:hypothetical protein